MFAAKYQAAVFAFIMSGFMAFLMSGILTLINLGWFDGFVLSWLKAYLIAHACAFPLVFIFAPLSRRLTASLIKPVVNSVVDRAAGNAAENNTAKR
ncbi:DUF2798 domain-containing protein [Arsukibacterium sp.]|uniref:DUF2798 domain-containing protein n=1 Tax=Arsukibacterium sp. TaxID=1977258 RepID=UPI002FD9DB34